MCPMRFILVFFSAILAGYFAWRTVRSSSDDPTVESSDDDHQHRNHGSAKDISFKKMAENGFWGFVDMASGRYLWRGIKELRGIHEDKPKFI